MQRENTVSSGNNFIFPFHAVHQSQMTAHTNVLNSRDLNVKVSSSKSILSNKCFDKPTSTKGVLEVTQSQLQSQCATLVERQNNDSRDESVNESSDGSSAFVVPTDLPINFSDDDKDDYDAVKPCTIETAAVAATTTKAQHPVKQIICQVLGCVASVTEHVDSAIEFQSRRQTEEMDKYIDEKLAKISQDIDEVERAPLHQPQPNPFEYCNIKRKNNNRASRLSRLKKKKRMETVRLGMFCFHQFNDDLERESRRLRAKIEKQLEFLAEGGMDVDAEIRLRSRWPNVGDDSEPSMSEEVLLEPMEGADESNES